MNNTRLEREISNTLETLSGYVSDLITEIESLERANDRKDEEINRLQDKIDELS